MNNCDQNTNSLLPLLAGFSEQRIMQNSFFLMDSTNRMERTSENRSFSFITIMPQLSI